MPAELNEDFNCEELLEYNTDESPEILSQELKPSQLQKNLSERNFKSINKDIKFKNKVKTQKS